MNFVAIDVETANPMIGSICQIGLAKYVKGKLVDTYETLIKVQGDFSQRNINIHGITAANVKDAPTIFDVFVEIIKFVGDNVVVSYTNFDERALNQCLVNADLPLPNWQWVDASLMVRQTCSKFSDSGFNLKNVCDTWGYQFKHHDALEDAKACGFIVNTVLRENSQSIADWLDDYDIESIIPKKDTRLYQETDFRNLPEKIAPQAGMSTGRFFGQCICFTGFFQLGRVEIANLASQHGFEIKSSVSKKVHYLILGHQDEALLVPGADKSTKHLKAEELIAKGHGIQIATEQEFLQMIYSIC